MASKKTSPKAGAGKAAPKPAPAPAPTAAADPPATAAPADPPAGPAVDQVEPTATAPSAPAAPVPPAPPRTGAVTRGYVVVSPLRRDRKAYGVGAPIVLTADQAAPLLGHTVKLPDTTDASEEAAAAGS